MIVYPTLFALDKQGKIRRFDIKIEPFDGKYYRVISNAGLLDSSGKDSSKLITKAKGKNTIYEQAVVEATSQFNEKLNEGYKSMEDLKVRAAALEVDLTGASDIRSIFARLKIEYNTDTRWYPLPMLAEKW